MSHIEKTLTGAPYFVPLSWHKLKAYTVFMDRGVVTATVDSYFSEQASQQKGAQPLATHSVVIKGEPTGDAPAWIYAELVKPDDGSVELVGNPYEYQTGFTVADRFLFAAS